MAKYREQRDENNALNAYVEPAKNKTIFINGVGYSDVASWLADGNIADPDPEILQLIKRKKIDEYKAEAIARITVHVPEWNSIETVKLIASIWNMLGTPNASQIASRDIFVYVKTIAIPAVNALTTVVDVQNTDVVNDVNWPSV